MTLRNSIVLGVIASLGCGTSSEPRNLAGQAAATAAEPATPAQAVKSSEGLPHEDTPAQAVKSSEGFLLEDPECESQIATYMGRGVITIDGADSGNRVDIVAKGPEASAKRACELALATHRLTGTLGQRVVQACSQSALQPDPTIEGWDMMSLSIAEGIALRARISDPAGEPFHDCTRVAWIHRSNHPVEKACREYVEVQRKTLARAEKASNDAVQDFLSKELARYGANEAEVCPGVEDHAMRKCESLRATIKALEERRDAPPEKLSEPEWYCQDAAT